jgi:hypothetical protein
MSDRVLAVPVQYLDPETKQPRTLEAGTAESEFPEGVEVSNPYVFHDSDDPDADLYGRVIQSPSAEDEGEVVENVGDVSDEVPSGTSASLRTP